MIIIHENKAYESVENELFSSFQQIETATQEPSIKWKKAPISLETWEDIKNICAYTYKEHNSECLIRLYYSPELDQWAPAFYKQKMSFMTVKDELDVEEIERQVPSKSGFVEAGSVHHHCASGAFQSKTDEDDEQNSEGLHITIGKLDESKYELHSRYSNNGCFLAPNMLSFFEHPEWLAGIPDDWRWRFSYTVIKEILQKPGDPDKARKDWISNVIPKTTTTITKSTPYNRHSYGGSGYGGYGGYNQSYFDKFDDEELPVQTSNNLVEHATEDSADDELQSAFEELLNDVVFDTSKVNEDITKHDWKEIVFSITTSINASAKQAKQSSISYMETMHSLIRQIIKDKQKDYKSIKSDLTLTNFLGWLNEGPEDEVKALIQDALIDSATDNNGPEETVPMFPIV